MWLIPGLRTRTILSLCVVRLSDLNSLKKMLGCLSHQTLWTTAEAARKKTWVTCDRKENIVRMPHTDQDNPMICNFTFYALGLVELQMMSQKIRNLKILILTPQTILCVIVLSNIDAVVVSSAVAFSRAWRCEFGLWRLVLVWFDTFLTMIFFSNTP